ncbi:MAG TPA: phosphate ABC transporter permease subunit PstC [Polyangiaceae bacterium]|nr:phosphate ABC transporter permease subunit PstC [Polyangiaceae bacterium]
MQAVEDRTGAGSAARRNSLKASASAFSPPSPFQRGFDVAFRGLSLALAGSVIALLLGIVYQVMAHAAPAIRDLGTHFLVETKWNPNKQVFGVLPEIVGTLYTSCLALLGGGLLGVTTALVTSQGFLSRRWELVLKNVIELLAAIPSVVYGLWGIFVLIPILRPVAKVLHEQFAFIPLFETPFAGPAILPAALVLAVMILPTITAISREALAAVPKRLPAAAYGLGATRWEVIFRVVIPTASGGLFGALVLGLGRALGETMALAMLVGNANVYGWSLLSPGSTIAALLANHFPEAGPVEIRALMYAALVLLMMTLIVNLLGAAIMARATRGLKGLV